MASTDLERFAGRSFSFYPPVLNVGHNEWRYEEGSWSEVRVRNTKSGQDLWIPRRFVGDVSQVEEPVMIVGLTQELEYKGGMLVPHRRRVLAMPGAPGAPHPPAGAPLPAPPHRGSESPTEKKIELLIGGALLLAIAGTLVLVTVTREREAGGRVTYEAIVQAELTLTGEDDYFSVVRKLGPPAADRWKAEEGERQYRALDYPGLGVTVILMGPDRDSVRYIGAKDANWRNAHSVRLPGGGGSDSILRSLSRF